MSVLLNEIGQLSEHGIPRTLITFKIKVQSSQFTFQLWGEQMHNLPLIFCPTCQLNIQFSFAGLFIFTILFKPIILTVPPVEVFPVEKYFLYIFHILSL